MPASRPRIPRYGKPYYPKTYKGWIDQSELELEPYDKEPIARPVRVDVLFAIPRSKTSKLLVPVGDGDNYEKAIYDLLQKKGYLSDDKWITSGRWRKRFLPFGHLGFTEIAVMEEDDEIDL